MARIRTIKPDFFRHEDLFEAERATGLPLRLAFAGLWTAADREGRFRWQPRALKLDCLPYDDCDFSTVLNELAAHGFIEKYQVDGETFAFIPNWKKHQVINNRESESRIPEPRVTPRDGDASATRHVPARVEGEKEGKGKEEAKASPAVAEKTPEKKSRRKPKLQIAENFVFPQKIRDYAAKLRFSAPEVDRELQRFVRHAKQNDRRCADWEAAAENWFDKAAEFAGKPPPKSDLPAFDDGMIEVLGEDELAAWDEYGRLKSGKTFPRNSKGGWRFPSRWPPGYVAPERSMEVPPTPILRSMQ